MRYGFWTEDFNILHDVPIGCVLRVVEKDTSEEGVVYWEFEVVHDERHLNAPGMV